MATTGPRARAVLAAAVLVPFWTSVLARSLAWLILLGRQGLVNQWLVGLGVLDQPARLLFNALGVQIGGRSVPAQPMELVRSNVAGGKEGAFVDAEPARGGSPRWDDGAKERLERVPSFVRGMVKRIYGDYAAERGIAVITPDMMDTARKELGLEGM